MSLEDEEHPEPPKRRTIPKIVAKVYDVVLRDRIVTDDQEFGHICWRHTPHLAYRIKLSARSVPRLLNADKKCERARTSNYNLKHVNINAVDFLRRFVMVDETPWWKAPLLCVRIETTILAVEASWKSNGYDILGFQEDTYCRLSYITPNYQRNKLSCCSGWIDSCHYREKIRNNSKEGAIPSWQYNVRYQTHSSGKLEELRLLIRRSSIIRLPLILETQAVSSQQEIQYKRRL